LNLPRREKFSFVDEFTSEGITKFVDGFLKKTLTAEKLN